MKDNFKIAADFAESIKRLRNKYILQIVLFGSVARGEDTPASDIDIAIIHNLDNLETLKSRVHKFQNEKIQATFIHINEIANEREIAGALSGDGLLLYGKPIYITEKRMSLSAKVLIFYSMKDIQQNAKVKLSRALYGSISISKSSALMPAMVDCMINSSGVSKTSIANCPSVGGSAVLICWGFFPFFVIFFSLAAGFTSVTPTLFFNFSKKDICF